MCLTQNSSKWTTEAVAAALFGEIHGMVAEAAARAGGETTPAHIAETTNISPIDLHHSVAELVKANLCNIDDGTIRLLEPKRELITLIEKHASLLQNKNKK